MNMLDFLKHFSKLGFKEDARKIGVNLATAGLVGVLITHLAQDWKSIILMSQTLLLGFGFILFGLYNKKR